LKYTSLPLIHLRPGYFVEATSASFSLPRLFSEHTFGELPQRLLSRYFTKSIYKLIVKVTDSGSDPFNLRIDVYH
jgi:hypothetical protein